MRRFINLLKQPIYKDDLLKVLKYGLLNMLIFSIFAGAIQFFLNVYIGIGFKILVYLIAYMIGKGVTERIFGYHILYPIILTLFFIFGMVLYNITFYSFLYHDISLGIRLIFTKFGFFHLAFPFLNIKSYVGIDILYNVLDILIIIFSIVTIWRFLETRK